MKALTLPLLLLLTGCSGPVPELQKYLLRADSNTAFTTQQPDEIITLGNLTLASYINGPGLVLETRPGEVHSARDHQWAEPLRESLRRFLARQIAINAERTVLAHHRDDANWQQRIDIRIDELHGTADGSARLVAYWLAMNQHKEVIAEHQFVDSQPLTDDGYAALVRAEKKLLERFAAAIAANL